MDLEVIHENQDVLVVKKPRGVATQSAKAYVQDMESMARNYRASKGQDSYIGVLSRLDTNVEGILVFGKNKKATADLSKQIQTGEFCKVYRARVNGVFEEKKGTLIHFLYKDNKTRTARVVEEIEAGKYKAKKAILHYEVISEGANESELEVRIDTGRFHQIRCQLSAIGHPICGDGKYGDTSGVTELALTAFETSFISPSRREKLTFHI